MMRGFYFIVVVLLISLISACSIFETGGYYEDTHQPRIIKVPTGQAPSKNRPTEQRPSSPQKNVRQAAVNVEEELKRAEGLASPQKEQLKLKMAALLIKQKQLVQARTVLKQVNPAVLSQSWIVYYRIVHAQYHMLSGRFRSALNVLRPVEPILSSVSEGQQIYLRKLLAYIYLKNQQPLVSIEHRIKLSQLLQNSDLMRNNQTLWQQLLAIDLSIVNVPNDSLSQGWFELANIHKRYGVGTSDFSENMENWVQRYSNHPAQLSWPGPFSTGSRSVVQSSPSTVFSPSYTQTFSGLNKVAVLLPLSGQYAVAGKAVLDGLMTAYYQRLGRTGSAGMSLLVGDTQQASASSLYGQFASGQGVDAVVGPLRKEEAESLLSSGVSKPVLLLNHLEFDTPNLTFQFAVTPDSEIETVVAHAQSLGFRRVLMISDSSSIGRRLAEGFRRVWGQVGGEFVDVAIDDVNAMSELLQGALHIDQSKTRFRNVQRVVGGKLKFEPRRRKDIDFVFLATSPSLARRVRPLLQFYYAAQLPVFATSHLYADGSDVDRGNDFESVMFPAYPWMLDKSLLTQTQLKEGMLPSQRSYRTLFSLGFDAFNVISQMPKIVETGRFSHAGLTGDLSLDDNRLIRRNMPWAYFKDGALEPYQSHGLVAPESEESLFTE